MGLSSLVDEAIAASDPDLLKRRMQPIVAQHLHGISTKFNIVNHADLQTLRDEHLMPLAVADPKLPSKTADILDSLVKFIPPELITLYLAAVAAAPAFKDALGISDKAIFWFFVAIVAPGLFMLITAAKRRSSDKSFLEVARRWPYLWKVLATVVAFAAWANVVPSSPFLGSESGKIVAAFIALAVSTVLSIADPLMVKP